MELLRGFLTSDWAPLLAGLIVGWLLSEFSVRLRSMGDRRRRLARAVSTLLSLYEEARTLRGLLESLKDQSRNTKEYERLRNRALNKYPSIMKSYEDEIRNCVDSISEYIPFQAVKLKNLIESYRYLPTISLQTIASASPDSYIRILSLMEIAFDGYCDALKSTLRRIAWARSATTFLRLEFVLFRIDKPSKRQRGNIEFLRDQMSIVSDDINNISSESDDLASDRVSETTPD